MRRLPIAVLAFALFAAGCAAPRPSGVAEYYDGDREEARRIFVENANAQPNGRALYLLRLGTLELESGNIGVAREAFIDAAGIMQDFKADGEFKALAGRESAKEYKGDPYEQMMALWYLGLLDYMFGEYDKALPDLKSAALADGGTREERYKSDAASVFIMMAKTYHALGDSQKAKDEYREAALVHTFRQTVERLADALGAASSQVAASAKEPLAAEVAYDFLADGISAGATREQDPAAAVHVAAEHAFELLGKTAKSRSEASRLRDQDPNIVSGYIREIVEIAAQKLAGAGPDADSPMAAAIRSVSDPSNNFLVVVGLGRGPFKFRTGEHGELAVIGRSEYPEKSAEIYVDGRLVGTAFPVEDVYYQASTRGGRKMDAILAGKAVFKEATAIGAQIAFAGAATADSKSGRRDALIAGAVLLAASLATQPQADVRSWETLPDKIQMLGARVAPGNHTVDVKFVGLGPTVKFENVEFRQMDETVLYVRSGGGGAWSVPSAHH